MFNHRFGVIFWNAVNFGGCYFRGTVTCTFSILYELKKLMFLSGSRYFWGKGRHHFRNHFIMVFKSLSLKKVSKLCYFLNENKARIYGPCKYTCTLRDLKENMEKWKIWKIWKSLSLKKVSKLCYFLNENKARIYGPCKYTCTLRDLKENMPCMFNFWI